MGLLWLTELWRGPRIPSRRERRRSEDC